MATFDEMADIFCQHVADTLKQKNHDYGDSFQKSVEKYGNAVPLIRIEDKLNRLSTLMMGEEKRVSESIDDTLFDLAGYAILTLITRERCQQQTHKETTD